MPLEESAALPESGAPHLMLVLVRRTVDGRKSDSIKTASRARILVPAIAPTIRKRDIWEGFLVGHIVGRDAVPNAIVGEPIERRTCQRTYYSPRGNVED